MMALGYFLRIVAVDLDYVPVPCAIFCSYVLAVYGIDHRGELHAVAVIEHYEVVKAEITGKTTCALRDLFLNTAVGDKGIGLVAHPFAEAGGHEALCDGAADSHCVAPPRGPDVFSTPRSG